MTNDDGEDGVSVGLLVDPVLLVVAGRGSIAGVSDAVCQSTL